MSSDKWELIKNLDLSTVKAKLREKKGFWWSFTKNIDKLEAEYRQFLFIAATHPEEVIVPWTQHLDDFWHEHILDTTKYEKDCQLIFGKMFHHNPHLLIGSKEQTKAFSKTKEMYKESFGVRAKSSSSSLDPGCGGVFVPVFCGGHSYHSSHDGHSHSDHGHSDSGSHSGHDGGSSCGGDGGSSDGGSSCGGGCGGGGD